MHGYSEVDGYVSSTKEQLSGQRRRHVRQKLSQACLCAGWTVSSEQEVISASYFETNEKKFSF